VQLLLELPARHNLRAFNRMFEELSEKSVGLFAQPIHQDNDLH